MMESEYDFKSWETRNMTRKGLVGFLIGKGSQQTEVIMIRYFGFWLGTWWLQETNLREYKLEYCLTSAVPKKYA